MRGWKRPRQRKGKREKEEGGRRLNEGGDREVLDKEELNKKIERENKKVEEIIIWSPKGKRDDQIFHPY